MVSPLAKPRNCTGYELPQRIVRDGGAGGGSPSSEDGRTILQEIHVAKAQSTRWRWAPTPSKMRLEG
eukprot:15477874-Alexandrium_andersonii.AAC.1